MGVSVAVEIDFKNLTEGQEQALRTILSKCSYLKESARHNVSDSVLVHVATELRFDYAALVNAKRNN
jgi:hypothetical protein